MKWRVTKDGMVISGVYYGAESIVTDEMLEKVSPRVVTTFKGDGTLMLYEEREYEFGEAEPTGTVVQIDDEIGTEETSG